MNRMERVREYRTDVVAMTMRLERLWWQASNTVDHQAGRFASVPVYESKSKDCGSRYRRHSSPNCEMRGAGTTMIKGLSGMLPSTESPGHVKPS
jgi:hypothetical protein